MKTITIYGLTAILLLGLTALAFAQSNSPMSSPAMQQAQRDGHKQMMNSFWNGEGSILMAIDLLQQDDFREGLGVSKEQHQRIQDTIRNTSTSVHADFDMSFHEEMNAFMMEHGNPFADDASDETREKFSEIQMRRIAEMTKISTERMINAVNDNLTSAQLKKFKEFQISLMSELPIVSTSMFEVLDLSDKQKEQLDRIRKDMKPEFEKFADKIIDAQMKFSEKVEDALEGKLEGVTDSEEQTKIRKEIQDNVRRNDPEMQRITNEVMGTGKKFTDELKIAMFDVLTDEQWVRMLDLIDNPPDYAKKVIAQIRKEMGTDDSSTDTPADMSGGWVPGPGSWRPGDAIPEGYRIERNTRSRFPRGEE
ncbi:MAG: hypothetical protein FWE95_05835 [Planctomycetaceae bacterium]|nr:hypothetical protein [Planctomycetaceae bacterium]